MGNALVIISMKSQRTVTGITIFSGNMLGGKYRMFRIEEASEITEKIR